MSDPLARLIDPERLAGWLDDHLPGAGAPLGVERITSGASNEVFVLRRAGAEWVLRRPALGAALLVTVLLRSASRISLA